MSRLPPRTRLTAAPIAIAIGVLSTVDLFGVPFRAAPPGSSAVDFLEVFPRAAQSRVVPEELIPFDRIIRAGTLSNGLAYFVRQNGRPANRVSLRLAVRAGSIEEGPSEQGLAHLIEHMAFEGSRHFKPGEVLSYFESAGAKLGPHVNAITSFDDTVYMLDIPTDKPEVLERGLTAFADFAGGLTFDPAALDKERAVVIEEWRNGLGAGSRIRDKQLPILLNGSRYAERLPIGKPEIVRTASAAALRTFYDRWYRPERMAVVAVGDIDPAQIERTIRSTFAALGDRVPAVPEPDRQLPPHRELLVSVVTDPEVTQSSVEIVRKRPRDSETRVSDYRRHFVEHLVERMFNARLSELARRPDARVLGAAVADDTLTPEVATFVARASVRDGQLEDGLRVLAIETSRVRRFGFTTSELDRAKKSIGALYARAYAERDTSESGSFASELLRHFLIEEPVPGIEYEYKLVQQAIAEVTPAEVSAAIARLLTDDGRVLLALAPQKPELHVPSPDDLRATLRDAERVEVTAWTDSTVTRALVDPKPRPAAVVARQSVDTVGVTAVRFANGVEAWLKPTDFKTDQILFTLESPGGTSLAPPDEYLEATLAASYVAASGAGGLKALDLQKLLAGQHASASPFAGLSAHGIAGSAAPPDLETALQLLYQNFVAPGDDPDMLPVLQRRLEAAIANREQSPRQVFADRVNGINSSNHYTTAVPTAERIRALGREKMMRFYRERFSNAADFVFVMVGSFTIDTAVPLVAQYVGSLPSSGRPASTFRDVAIHFPASEQRARVQKGEAPRSQVVISFFADPPADPDERENLHEATTVLESSLTDILRESLGQTYTVSVGLDQPRPQRGAGHVAVTFAGAPENIDSMTDRVLEAIKQLQKDGPSEDLTERAKTLARRNDETALKQNPHWLAALTTARVLGEDPADIVRRGERIDRVTTETLQRTFQRYFPLDRFTVVTLVPSGPAGPGKSGGPGR